MKILVIIVSYKDKGNLRECLRSLKSLGLDVYVHDNSRNNLGFAAGVNAALHFAQSKQKYDWVWLLNPDCTVQVKGKLDEFIRVYGNKYDIFSPVVYDEHGKIWFAGGKINKWTGECTHSPTINKKQLTLNKIQEKINKYKDIKSWGTEWVSGCSMFVKPAVFEKIGFFDERFFLFYEDVDFCLRARSADFRIGTIPDNLRVIHKVSQSVNKLPNKYTVEIKSKFYLLKKHWRYFFPTAYLISKLRYYKHKLNYH
jgi:hypothetical protein